MINSDKTGLIIFDNFHIDFNLPKWKKRSNKNDDSTPMLDSDSSPSFNRFGRSRRGGAVSGFLINPTGIVLDVPAVAISGSTVQDKKPGLFDRLFGRAKKRRKLEEQRIKQEMEAPNFTISEVNEPEPQEMSAYEFFQSVKNSAEELKLLNERFQNYEKAIAHLKRTGQIAMLEKMEYELEIHRAESQLYAIGFTKVVTEDNIVEFAKKSNKNLRLDWIKNFTRLIPEKVLEAKEKCDENNIFDNYVILHYDPYNDGVLETLAERAQREAKEKDPILFGVIAGSNKLYYIADWIDEYCDLTFDKLVETLGEDAINANDITAEIKMLPR